MALRLFPLFCGILALFAFLPVARHFLRPLGVSVALGILALAPPLVYHSVEIKQYSAELLATVLCLLWYTWFNKKESYSALVAWGVLGAVIIWFSFTSIFVLAGMAMGAGLYHLLKKEWSTVFKLAIPFGLWFVSFVVNYFLFTQKHADSEWLLHFFRIRGSFMPFPATSFEELIWPIQRAGTRLLDYPLGLLWDVSAIPSDVLQFFLRRPVFAIISTLVGFVLLFKRDKKFLMTLVFSYVLVLIASALEMYPVYERLTVFLAPLLIMIVAVGCERIALQFWTVSKGLSFAVAMLLVAAPFWASAKQIVNPGEFGGYKKAYYREALLQIENNYQEGDQVYVYWNMLAPYHFYKDTYYLPYDAIEGSDFRAVSSNAPDYLNKLGSELNGLKKNKRVWLFYSKKLSMNIGDFDKKPVWYINEVLGGKDMHKKFSEMGKEVYTYDTHDLKVSLFEMKPSE
ncbi:hypothetical protein [Rufibacter tibetensis]|nr:hypothetical protein [Rufibacter tibetensis]